MKKFHVAIALTAFLAAGNALHAQSAKECFLQMPDSLLPYLTKVNKEDMPDFIESKMAAKVRNRFQGTTEMKELTTDYLRIETTSASSLQLKLLPLSDGTRLIAMLTTVQGSAADSRVRFFTTDWKELSASKYLSLPQPDRFMLPVGTPLPKDTLRTATDAAAESVTTEEEGTSLLTDMPDSLTQELYAHVLEGLNDAVMLSCHFIPADHSLRISLESPLYLDENERKVAYACLRKSPLLMRWENDRFVTAE